MNVIVPMAGRGKRMRPHSLTVPKPLIPVAGKPIVHHLVEGIVGMVKEKIDNIVFIIKDDFGKEIEQNLLDIAQSFNANGVIKYQDEALGTAHAIYCAGDYLNSKVVIGFADTIFKADFLVDGTKDGIIWVDKVDDPRPFGVIKIDENNFITDFVEKPQEFVSDLAIIGIYYLKDGEVLRKNIKHLIDNNLKEKGEFQITNALEMMKKQGYKLEPGKVKNWLDCGNKDATLYSNSKVLEIFSINNGENIDFINTKVIEPCYIGNNVTLKNCTIGPHVSIGNNTSIENSTIKNTIIQNNTEIKNANLINSMLGNYVIFDGEALEYSLGDYSTLADTFKK